MQCPPIGTTWRAKARQHLTIRNTRHRGNVALGKKSWSLKLCQGSLLAFVSPVFAAQAEHMKLPVQPVWYRREEHATIAMDGLAHLWIGFFPMKKGRLWAALD